MIMSKLSSRLFLVNILDALHNKIPVARRERYKVKSFPFYEIISLRSLGSFISHLKRADTILRKYFLVIFFSVCVCQVEKKITTDRDIYEFMTDTGMYGCTYLSFRYSYCTCNNNNA